jgi:O-antigen ligase
MELIFKQVLPIILYAYLFIFEYKSNRKIILTLILFCGYISFSSNYGIEIYRTLFQLIQVGLMISYLINYKFDFLKFPTGKILTIFFVFILISSVGNTLDTSSYYESILNFATIFFTIVYLNKNIDTIQKLYRVLRFIKRLAVIMSVFAIITFAFEHVRVELTTNNTNYLAFFLGIGLCIALFLPVAKKNKLVIPVICLGIVFTSSRIIIISSAIVILIYILTNKRRLLINLVYISFGIVITLSAVNIADYIDQSRYKDLNQDVSTVTRLEIIETSKKVVAENPFNGIGYNQFQTKFLKYASKNSQYLTDQDEIVTHNDFLRVIDELGVPAFIFFVFVVISQFMLIWKLPINFRRLVLSLFITDILYSTSHNNLNTYVFWFFLMLPGMASYLLLKNKYVKKVR